MAERDLPETHEDRGMSPEEVYRSRVRIIETRYSRMRLVGIEEGGVVPDDYDPEAVPRRSLWLGKIAMAAAEIERNGGTEAVEEDDEITGPISYFSSKLRVMEQFPAVRSPDDVEELNTVLWSVSHFCSGYGYRKNEDEEEFFNDLLELIDEGGVNVKSLSSLFKVWEGMATINPTLLPAIFTGKEVAPLDGLEFAQSELAEIDGLFKESLLEKDERLLKKIIPMQNMMANAEKKNGKVKKWGTIDNLLDFTNRLSTRRRTYEGSDLDVLFDAADHLGVYLTELKNKETGFNITRPASPETVYTPLSIALGEKIVEENFELDEAQISTISARLVGTIRRGRLALSRESLFSFLGAFRDLDQIDTESLPTDSKKDIAKGLGTIDKMFSHLDSDVLVKLKTIISDRLIPELILQLRAGEYQLFVWNQRDYKALGLSDKWDEHEVKLSDLGNRELPGPGSFKKGNVLISYKGQLQPPTAAHIELLREVSGLTFNDLVRARMLNFDDFVPGKNIGVSVNSGNPKKVDWPERERLLQQSLRGINGIFMWSEHEDEGMKDSQGPTSIKLASQVQTLKDHGKGPAYLIHLCGTDGLNKYKKMFTEAEEPKGWEELNRLPHIFALQRDDMIHPGVLIENLRQIYSNFNGTITYLVSIPEVHSSYFVHMIPYLSDEALSTLVHPSIIPELRKVHALMVQKDLETKRKTDSD